MKKDLTESHLERQNILNNSYAVSEIEKATNITTIHFEGQKVLLKEQVAQFFEIDVRTVERYLEKYDEELKRNGYSLLKGKRLQEFKSELKKQELTDIHVGDKTRLLSIFNFRSFLNIAMLLTESEKARLLRKVILDIVIDTINKRTGGATRYINQRDEDFIFVYFQEEKYKKEFTDALRDYENIPF